MTNTKTPAVLLAILCLLLPAGCAAPSSPPEQAQVSAVEPTTASPDSDAVQAEPAAVEEDAAPPPLSFVLEDTVLHLGMERSAVEAQLGRASNTFSGPGKGALVLRYDSIEVTCNDGSVVAMLLPILPDIGWKTAEGLGHGSTLDAVQAAYPHLSFPFAPGEYNDSYYVVTNGELVPTTLEDLLETEPPADAVQLSILLDNHDNVWGIAVQDCSYLQSGRDAWYHW